MFSLMVAWLFFRNRHDTLSRLIITLMLVVAACFLKDLFTVGDDMLSVMVDVVAIPIYACILYELCKPGKIKPAVVFFAELPFVVLPFLFATTSISALYYIDMGLGIILGLVMFFWTCFAIPKYNRALKAAFSYNDDIDFRWLSSILWVFFVLLAVWGLSCVFYNPWFDIAYMCCAMVMWCFVCLFLYKHKSVVEDLKPVEEVASNDNPRNDLFERIRHIIIDEQLYLNPQLKLSDIATLIGTNRSYVSAFFSAEQTTFYDYINRIRINHAKRLLADRSLRIDDIATDSGYSSRRSFHRVFLAFEKVSPSDYRMNL